MLLTYQTNTITQISHITSNGKAKAAFWMS